jgi:hypothetical protein
MVRLPTFVQNPPTPNDIANLTGLDRRQNMVWTSSKISCWVAGCPSRWGWSYSKQEDLKKGKKEKK